MTRNEILSYAAEQYGTPADKPFSDNNADVLRHTENRKWYTLFMNIEYEKLGIKKSGFTDVMNVKCDPYLITSLSGQKGFMRAYHMNKQKWLTVILDGTVGDDEIKSLLDISYELTGSKAARQKRLTD